MSKPGSRLSRDRIVLALVALVALLAAVAVPATAAPDKEQLEEQRERLEEEQRELEENLNLADADSDELLARIRVVDAERADMEARVADLDAQLADLNAQISEAETALSRKQQELVEIDGELKVLQAKLDRRLDVFTGRAVAAYKSGPGGQLDALLSSDSFSDMLNKYEYYESALEADSEILEDIQILEGETEVRYAQVEEKKDEIAATKLDLETSRNAVAAIRGEKAEALQQLEDKLDTKEILLARIESKKDTLQGALAEIESDSQRIESLLADIAAREAAPPPSTSAAPSAPSAPDTGAPMFWPTSGGVVSPYGPRTHPIFGDTRMHTGVDIGGAYGQAVWAGDDGVVAFVGVMSGYGNVVVIDHGGGLATTYNHLSSFSVNSGQSVSRGQTVGAVGCTGYCTGPHLHFEVRINGSPVDPMPYLS